MEAGPSVCAETGAIRNLPLWRVQWNCCPGLRDVYNVHLPHYTNMFEGIMRRERPWLFGHLYLPGGSSNMRNEAYALRAGTKAPLTGTLMDLLEARRLDDGRVCVVAQGIGRFRVTEVTRERPHFEVDALLVLDSEEVAEHGDAAVQVALRWRDIEYATADIALNRGLVPEIAPVKANSLGYAERGSDELLRELELQVWAALVRCCHLLLQCLKRQGAIPPDAKVKLPTGLLELQPPGVDAKILVGADCLRDAPPCYLPPQRRAMRLSFVVLTAVAQGLVDRAAPFAALANLGDAFKDRAVCRQSLLDHDSTHDRLTFVLKLLDAHASKLTAFLLL